MTVAELTLPEIAAIVADWADRYPWVDRVALFGSRVRGDYRPDSDLDLFTWTGIFDGEQAAWIDDYWDGIPELRERLGIVIHPCGPSDDGAQAAIHAGRIVHQDRKVSCVVTARLISPATAK